MKKKLSTLLVIFGIILISIPFISEYYIKYTQEKLYKEMLDKIEKSANNNKDNINISNNIDNSENSINETTVDI